MPTIEVLAGPKDVGKRIPISVGAWVIGRDLGVALQLLDPRVSRRHLRISCERKNDPYFVEDLDSEAGTFLHGEYISAPVELTDGDQIIMGNTTLVFRRDLAARREPRLLSTRQRQIPTIKDD